MENYKGSKHFSLYREDIWRADPPLRYTHLRDIIPGERVLEVGSAEGVLTLLLAEKKKKSAGLELKKGRHKMALELKNKWLSLGRNVGHCEFYFGTIDQHKERLPDYDTVVAIRVIYHMGDGVDEFISLIAKTASTVVLGGNRGRAKKYFDGRYVDDRLGEANYLASKEGMVEILERHGYTISSVMEDQEGDPIVVGVKAQMEKR